jgi:hypothetical protein
VCRKAVIGGELMVDDLSHQSRLHPPHIPAPIGRHLIEESARLAAERGQQF